MIIMDARKNEVEIKDIHWPLAENLFISRWGATETGIKLGKTKKFKLKVKDIYNITSELSVWGIPWTYHD